MTKNRRSVMSGLVVVSLLSCFLLIQGCASEGKPTAKIANADLAVREAREANAINLAPLDLRLAEDKLSQARAAADKDKNKEAARLADEAFADARTAEARSRAEKSRQTAQQMQEGVTTLQRELSVPQAQPGR